MWDLVASSKGGHHARLPEVIGPDAARSSSSPSMLDHSAETHCGFVESTVATGSLIVTDDWSEHKLAYGKRRYEHLAVAECGDPDFAEQ